MKPKDKLAEIEGCYGKFGTQSDQVHIAWLIARVRRLAEALNRSHIYNSCQDLKEHQCFVCVVLEDET